MKQLNAPDLIRSQLALSIQTLQSVHDDASIHQTLLAMATLTASAMRSGRTHLVAGFHNSPQLLPE